MFTFSIDVLSLFRYRLLTLACLSASLSNFHRECAERLPDYVHFLLNSCTVPNSEMVGRGRGQLAWRRPGRHFALTHRVASCSLPSPGLVEHGGQNVCLPCASLTQIFHSPLSCSPAIDAPSSRGKDGVVDACGGLNDQPLKAREIIN